MRGRALGRLRASREGDWVRALTDGRQSPLVSFPPRYWRARCSFLSRGGLVPAELRDSASRRAPKASPRRRSPLGEDVDMSYPLLISRIASATTGAFLSAARTICGKAAGRMDGEFTLILIAAWERQSPANLASQAVVRSPCATTAGGNRPRTHGLASIERPGHGGAEWWPPSKSLQRRIRDA